MIESYIQTLATTGEVVLKVKVHTGARATRVKSVLTDGVVKIDLQAVPEQGKGNDALLDFLAETFGVSKNNISIMLGKFSADKTIRIVR